MPIVSSHMPQRTSDCCCRSCWKRGRRCQARASIPQSASGSSHAICPASGSLKRRNRLGVPVPKNPPKPPAGCCPAFLPMVFDPLLLFVEGAPLVGGVPEVGLPFLPAFPASVGVFVLTLVRDLPPNPPLPNPLSRRSIPL